MMRIRRNRITSGILAFVMTAVMVLQVLPPVEVRAENTVPTAVTMEPTDITTTSVILHGKITANGGAAITQYGFVYNINGTEGTKTYTGSLNKGEDISFELTGLSPDDYIYYVFYAYNAVGKGQGDAVEVSTLKQYLDDYPVLISPEMDDAAELDDASGYAEAVETVPCDDDFTIEWDNVGCDEYTVYVKALNSDPDPGSINESGYAFSEYEQQGYTGTSITIDQSDLEAYAGKWWKVSISGMCDNGQLARRCDSYFQVEEASELIEDNPPLLISPEIDEDTIEYDEENLAVYAYAKEEVMYTSPITVYWDASSACDYYEVHATVLNGEPSPGSTSEKGTELSAYDYPEDDPIEKSRLNISSDNLTKYAGKWWKFSVRGFNDNGTYTYTAHTYFYVSEEAVPDVYTLEVSPATDGTLSDTYEFTAYAVNTDYVVFKVVGADDLILDIAENNGEDEFYGSYTGFTSAGSRTIIAYPSDEDGNIVDGGYSTCKIYISSEGTLSPVTITTPSYQTIAVGSSFTVEWDAPEEGSDDLRYNVYLWYGSENTEIYDGITAESVTIPASALSTEGTYRIAVYAVSDTWEASSAAVVRVIAEADVPALEDFRLSASSVNPGKQVSLSGTVDGNGSEIETIEIRITNVNTQETGVYQTVAPGAAFYTLDGISVNTAHELFDIAGSYRISVYARSSGGAAMHLLGSGTLKLTVSEKTVLETPEINGPSSVAYGEAFEGTIYSADSNTDYYIVYVGSTTFYKQKVKADSSSDTTAFTIPAGVFTKVAGESGAGFTIGVTARSNNEDDFAAGSDAEKTILYAGKGSAAALIKSVEMKQGDTITGGTTAVFTVITTTDVTAIRMKDGAGTFVVNTWFSEYEDSGDDRIWTVEQKINYAGGESVSGTKRMLTFYSMIGSVEYNSCNVSFYCVKGDTLGSFRILNPAVNASCNAEHDLTVTWSEPANGDSSVYYIMDVVHDGVRIDEDVFPLRVDGTEYTLSGDWLIQDNHAWKIQVTARSDDEEWAESTAYTSFTLKCAHDHKGSAKQEILYYTNTGDAKKHEAMIRYTYPCLDCGLENAEVKEVPVSYEHTVITLEKGGTVCSLCWYHESDGYAKDHTYKLDLSKVTGRQDYYVYRSVDANGDPTGIQRRPDDRKTIRQLAAEDEITILGELGNCYFVAYPVSGGVWWGFVKQELLYDPAAATGEEDTNEKILINGQDLGNLIYDEESSSWYCPLADIVEIFDGEYTVGGKAWVYNPKRMSRYVADTAELSILNTSMVFDPLPGIWQVEVPIKHKNVNGQYVLYVEVNSFAVDVCGTTLYKVDTPEYRAVYAIDYLALGDEELTRLIENAGHITSFSKICSMGHSFYIHSVEGTRLAVVNTLQFAVEAATLDFDKWYEYISRGRQSLKELTEVAAGETILRNLSEQDRKIIQMLSDKSDDESLDPVAYETLMDIIDGSEKQFLLELFGEGADFTEGLASFCGDANDTLDAFEQILNLINTLTGEELEKGKQFLTVITDFLKKYDLLGNDIQVTDDAGKIIGNINADALNAAFDVMSTMIKYMESYVVYQMNYETVEYLKGLAPYLERNERTILNCIINKFEQFSLEFLLGDVVTSVEKSALLWAAGKVIAETPLVVLQFAGKGIDLLYNNKEKIYILNKMAVLDRIIEAVFEKVEDCADEMKKTGTYSDNTLDILRDDYYMMFYLHVISDEYAREYVNIHHQGPIYAVKRFFDKSIYTKQEYASEVNEEIEILEKCMEILASYR